MPSLSEILTAMSRSSEEAVQQRREFVDRDTIPEEENTFLEDAKWHRIPNVACLFLDMVGSSRIDYDNDVRTSTRVYESFTGSLVRIWRVFGASYYDIKGDGGFALFDGTAPAVRGFLAGETFRTLVSRHLRPQVIKLTGDKVHLATRTSLSFGSVVVKRIGARGRYNNNLVWLGSTVNQGAKLIELASKTENEEEFVVSNDAFGQLKHDRIYKSCGCRQGGSGPPVDLWTPQDTPTLEYVGLKRTWRMRSLWCTIHGDSFFEEIARHFRVPLGAL